MTKPTRIDAVFSVLSGADPDVMDADELERLTVQIARLKGWCDSLQVRATRRQRSLAAEGRATAPRDTLSNHGRNSSKNAKAIDDRETICSALPRFEDALTNGAVSAGHVDAIANATRSLDEPTFAEFLACQDDLLADAERQRVDSFERSCRDLARHLVAQQPSNRDADELDEQRKRSNVKRWVDKSTGMCHTHLELDPVRDRALWAAIDHRRAQLRQRDGNRRTPWAQLQVDAVIEAVSSGDRADRIPEITVLVDHGTLTSGLHEHSICETDHGTPLPVSTVRRLCCEAEILPVVLSGDGRALDVGRASRTATRDQRRALRAMHRSCIHPDCTVTFEACRIHHVTPWGANGLTDLDDLAPVCETHHHLVHEGGWRLTLASGRIATWTRPDGVVFHSGPTVDRAPKGLVDSSQSQLTTV